MGGGEDPGLEAAAFLFLEEKAPAKRHYPEWVLVDGAPLPEQDAAGGAGPGMKIGAGGKPQG